MESPSDRFELGEHVDNLVGGLWLPAIVIGIPPLGIDGIRRGYLYYIEVINPQDGKKIKTPTLYSTLRKWEDSEIRKAYNIYP